MECIIIPKMINDAIQQPGAANEVVAPAIETGG